MVSHALMLSAPRSQLPAVHAYASRKESYIPANLASSQIKASKSFQGESQIPANAMQIYISFAPRFAASSPIDIESSEANNSMSMSIMPRPMPMLPAASCQICRFGKDLNSLDIVSIIKLRKIPFASRFAASSPIDMLPPEIVV